MQILIMQLHTQWGRKLRLGEVNRSTSSAKGREQILTTPNLTPSTPWQWLETLFMAKGNPGRMQHPPGSSVSHFWQCCHYSCRIVWDNGSNTAFSQSTGHRRRTRMLSPSPQNICRLVGQNAKHFWYSCDDKELDHWSIARMKNPKSVARRLGDEIPLMWAHPSQKREPSPQPANPEALSQTSG